MKSNSERPHKSKSYTRARFVDDVRRDDGTRISASENSPYRQRVEFSGSRRRKDNDDFVASFDSRYHHRSYGHDDDNTHSPTRRRRRISHRHDYHNDSFSDNSSEDTDFYLEDLPPSLTFHFNLGRVATEEEHQTPTAPKTVKQSARPDAKEYRYKLYHENILNVVRSRYTSGNHAREDSTIELITDSAHEPWGRRRPELVKWIQIDRQYPNFGLFIDYVSHLDCLDYEANQDAMSLLRQVRDKHEKPLHLPQGKKGKYIESNVTLYNILSNDDASERDFSKKQRSALLLCMPYFCLAPYSTDSASQASELYPLRTLLQSWHMSTPKKRDLQQAICDLEYPTKGQVFHVPQIWCLILGNNLLITCMHSPTADTKRSLSGITVKPASAEDNHPLLRVSYGRSRVWLLAVRSCKTWLEFVANFREIDTSFENYYDVLFAGVPQDASSWPSLIERAQKVTVELTLRWNNSYNKEISDSSYSTSSDESSDSNGIIEDSSSKKTSTKSADLAVSSSRIPISKGLDRREKTRVSSRLSGSKSDSSEAKLNESIPKRKSINLPSTDDSHIFSFLAAIPKISEVSIGQSQDISHQDHTINVDEGIKAGRSFLVDRNMIENNLMKMHTYFCTSQFKRNREYRKCPVGTIGEVNATLASSVQEEQTAKSEPVTKSHRSRDASDGEKEGLKGSGDISSDRDSEESSWRIRAQRKRKFVRITKKLFQLFLPLDHTSEMVSKYWGAVKLLLQDEGQIQKCTQALETKWGFQNYPVGRDIWHYKFILNNLSLAQAPLLPEGLREAWPRLVMFLVLSTAKRHREARSELLKFRQLAYESRRELMKSLARESLHRREAVLPLGITSLVIKNLLEDVTLGLPNIASTYSECLKILRQELSSNPYSRVHQEKIMRFRQEVASASHVLDDQLHCANKLLEYVGEGALEYVDEGALDSRPREYHILQDCKSSIEGRIRNFREMNEDADQLADWNIDRIESNKDRNEAAILVFTTVTVIFLPMSFVSSVFGMNTADIRNMDKQQWIFWISAVPVTIIVISISLFVIRYFESTRQALGQFIRRKCAEELEVLATPGQRLRAPVYPEPPPPYPEDIAPNSLLNVRRPITYMRNDVHPSPSSLLYDPPIIPMSAPRHKSDHIAPRRRPEHWSRGTI